MLNFTIFTANCIGSSFNIVYPNKNIITDEASLKKAVKYDHVTAEYKSNKRGNTNFIKSDVIPMDCDNKEIDSAEKWITPADVAVAFPGVTFAVVYSRNNMKQKGDNSPRPRFHVYFPVPEINSVSEYSDIKKRIAAAFPHFDNNAVDGARFLYGTPNPKVELFNGNKSIIDFLDEKAFADWDSEKELIPEGSRNNSMSQYAAKVIVRFGNTEKARELFLKRAEKCNPPLPEAELDTIWNSALKFGRKVSQNENYVPPEVYNKAHDLRPPDYSDIGQAKALVNEYKGELVYTDATDYMRYDGIRWAASKQMAVGACEEFLDFQLEDAEINLDNMKTKLQSSGIDSEAIEKGGRTLEKQIDSSNKNVFSEYKKALNYYAFVMKRRDMKYIISALQAAKPMLLKDISDFDNSEFLLNTPDATYDLRFGTDGKNEHKPEDHITKVTAVNPDKTNMKMWLEAVDKFFSGDKDLIDYVQKIVGLAAIGKIYVESLIIAYGGGGNGKSTFWNAIASVLGNYSGNISADTLTIGCKRNVKPEMAELKGKRLVIAAELEEGKRLSTSILKQLCSTDDISAEKKYGDPFSFKPTHTLVLYTNHLPKIGAIDAGTWRRIIVIPFNAKFEKTNDTKNYADFLVENAGGAILTWIIEGAKKAVDCGFDFVMPQCVKEAINKYRQENDWFSHFIEECCETNPTYKQSSGEIYQEYRAFCVRTGEFARSTSDFYSTLETAGFEKVKKKDRAYIIGLRIKPDFENSAEQSLL